MPGINRQGAQVDVLVELAAEQQQRAHSETWSGTVAGQPTAPEVDRVQGELLEPDRPASSGRAAHTSRSWPICLRPVGCRSARRQLEHADPRHHFPLPMPSPGSRRCGGLAHGRVSPFGGCDAKARAGARADTPHPTLVSDVCAGVGSPRATRRRTVHPWPARSGCQPWLRGAPESLVSGSKPATRSPSATKLQPGPGVAGAADGNGHRLDAGDAQRDVELLRPVLRLDQVGIGRRAEQLAGIRLEIPALVDTGRRRASALRPRRPEENRKAAAALWAAGRCLADRPGSELLPAQAPAASTMRARSFPPRWLAIRRAVAPRETGDAHRDQPRAVRLRAAQERCSAFTSMSAASGSSRAPST